MKKYLTAALGLAVVFSLLGASGRHMRLLRSVPAADTTLAASPDSVQLWFSQDPDLSVSRLTLVSEAGRVELGETHGGTERSLVALVASPLAPGQYTLRWRTAGDDGHVLRNAFSFTIVATDADEERR